MAQQVPEIADQSILDPLAPLCFGVSMVIDLPLPTVDVAIRPRIYGFTRMFV
jgi:hypothetical protein